MQSRFYFTKITVMPFKHKHSYICKVNFYILGGLGKLLLLQIACSLYFMMSAYSSHWLIHAAP